MSEELELKKTAKAILTEALTTSENEEPIKALATLIRAGMKIAVLFLEDDIKNDS